MAFSTNAYNIWRVESQAIFDFSVLVSYSVPSLKMQISLLEKGKIQSLPRPDYYRSTKEGYYSSDNLLEGLKRRVSTYKQQTSSYMLLSLFSHFEAFVVDVVRELFDFHGGVDKFIKNYDENVKKSFEVGSQNCNIKRKLTGNRKPQRRPQYQEISRNLARSGYMFPNELLSGYGIKMLNKKLGDLKSKEIPEVLMDCFHIEFSDDEVREFHNLRDLRNSIAHGRPPSLNIKSVTEKNQVLIGMAKKIDAHLSENFFIFNEYR